MSLAKSYVETQAGALHVRRARENDGARPLVILQILPIAGQLFHHALPLFAARGFDAVQIDLLGYGRSDPRRATYRVEDFAAQFLEAADRLKLERFALLGGHFCGLVAACLAVRHPTRVAALILDGAPVMSGAVRAQIGEKGMGTPPPFAADGSHLPLLWSQFTAMMQRLNPALALEPAHADTLHALFLDWIAAVSGVSTTVAFASFDMEAHLPKITQPTLILAGDHDTQRGSYETLRAGIAQACGHWFAGVHPLHDVLSPERAGEYVDVVDGFLKGLPH
jgi:pimeloyl-ACP methyl ester carboxylesterase